MSYFVLVLSKWVTAFATAVWGTTYFVTTEYLPPDRPLLAGLLRALPENGFQPIPGQPPVLSELDEAERKWGCVFCQRCPDVPGVPPCNGNPDLVEVGDRRVAAHPPC